MTLPGPGLAKTKRPPLYTMRSAVLVAGSDARWKAAFDEADVVSEGAASGADPTRRYFGSTDILLLVQPERGGDDMRMLAKVIAADPHVRLRAVRMARREAAQRALGPLDRVETEITVVPRTGGIAVHVEVEAAVHPERRSAPRPA
jgi:hypothetical protein